MGSGISIYRSDRYVPPSDFKLKVDYYSVLANSYDAKYESGVFEAEGYKWRLSLYPRGNLSRSSVAQAYSQGYVSLYLEIVETEALPLGWEVHAEFKFFLYDQIQDKYLTIQDIKGGVRRFNQTKTEWGIEECIPHDTLHRPENGYLVNDSCTFGVEINVIKKSSGRVEHLTLSKHLSNTYTWKIEKFSTLMEDKHIYSEAFTIGGRKWKLSFVPRRYNRGKGRTLSVYLRLDDVETHSSKRKLFARYKLRIINQVTNNDFEKTGSGWFSTSKGSQGFYELKSLSYINETGFFSSEGFVKDDTLIIQVEIDAMSVVKDFS